MRAVSLLSLLLACGGTPSIAIAIAPASSVAKPAPTPFLPAPRPGSNVRVHVDGVHQVSAVELADAVDIDKPDKHPGASNRDVMERDVLVIQAELYDRGYVEGKVHEPSVAIGADGVIDVTYTIEEGARFRLSKLEVEEKDDRTGKLVTPLQGTKYAKAGEWFSRKTLVLDVNAIQTTYRDAGYGIVDVVPETVFSREQHTIDVKIVIKRGPIVTFHAVRVDPPDALIAADTARNAGVTPGARYSETNLMRIKSDLASKGMHVDISTQETRGKPDAVDVMIEVH